MVAQSLNSLVMLWVGVVFLSKARIEKFKSHVKWATKKQLCSFVGLCGYYRKFVLAEQGATGEQVQRLW